jgi:hypothetical protein
MKSVFAFAIMKMLSYYTDTAGKSHESRSNAMEDYTPTLSEEEQQAIKKAMEVGKR